MYLSIYLLILPLWENVLYLGLTNILSSKYLYNFIILVCFLIINLSETIYRLELKRLAVLLLLLIFVKINYGLGLSDLEFVLRYLNLESVDWFDLFELLEIPVAVSKRSASDRRYLDDKSKLAKLTRLERDIWLAKNGGKVKEAELVLDDEDDPDSFERALVKVNKNIISKILDPQYYDEELNLPKTKAFKTEKGLMVPGILIHFGLLSDEFLSVYNKALSLDVESVKLVTSKIMADFKTIKSLTKEGYINEFDVQNSYNSNNITLNNLNNNSPLQFYNYQQMNEALRACRTTLGNMPPLVLPESSNSSDAALRATDVINPLIEELT